MQNYEKLLKKKKKNQKEMSDVEMDAKKSVIEHMRDMASGMMGENLKNLKKVTVASDSKEGLKEGLDKAENLLENTLDAEESGEDSVAEGAEEAEDITDALSEEELDAKLEKLMALKEKMKAKKESY